MFTALLLGSIAALALQTAPQVPYVPPPPPPPATAPPPTIAPAPGPPMAANQLDTLVGRIALYPDPLLTHVLTAATFWDQIPEAAQWANQHSYFTGDRLADAIHEDNLDWDPQVVALVPFPGVLNMMAQDMAWTRQLGTAVLTQRAEVMDAIQRQRRQAMKYGYVRTNAYESVVDSGGYVEILPVNPEYVYVPMYDPLIVFGPPRVGIVVTAVIRFGPAIIIGPAFAPWGWVHPYFSWRTHDIFFDATPWRRVWENRGFYVHPFEHPFVREPRPREERHERRP